MKYLKFKHKLTKTYKCLCVKIHNYKTKIKYYIIMHLPLNRKKIIFDNFGGKGYGENPKFIAEEIHRQGLNWDMVWLTKNINIELPEYVRPVKYGTFEAHKELATAKVFIDNIRNSNRIQKKKKQIYLQTWHGPTTFKRVEKDVEKLLSPNYVMSAKNDGNNCDAIIVANDFQLKEFQRAFWLNDNVKFLKVGIPRYDDLYKAEKVNIKKQKAKNFYNIDDNVKIILYMPTFRDNKRLDGYITDIETIINSFEKRFNEDFICLVRFHPNVANLSNFITYNERIINCTAYEDIQELICAGDYLITDYSSVAYDFSILHRPVFLCAIDYEKYISERPLWDYYPNTPFNISYSYNELINNINSFNEDEYWKRFYSLSSDYYSKGDSSKKTVEWLKNYLKV